MAVPRTNLEAAASRALRHSRTRSMPQEPQGRAGLLLPALPSFGKQKPLEIQMLVLRLLPASAKLTCTKRHKKTALTSDFPQSNCCDVLLWCLQGPRALTVLSSAAQPQNILRLEAALVPGLSVLTTHLSGCHLRSTTPTSTLRVGCDHKLCPKECAGREAMWRAWLDLEVGER